MKNQAIYIALGIAIVLVFSILILSSGELANASSSDINSENELSDYNIVYLYSGTGDLSEAVSYEDIVETTGAKTYTSWQEVASFESQKHLDALLIQDGALSQVDPTQLQQIYKGGTILVFFNTYTPAIESLTGDACISRDHWMDVTDPMGGDFYVMVYRLMTGSAEDLALIEGQNPCGGEVVKGLQGEVDIHSGGCNKRPKQQNRPWYFPTSSAR